jgi:hypothetical protein
VGSGARSILAHLEAHDAGDQRQRQGLIAGKFEIGRTPFSNARAGRGKDAIQASTSFELIV